MRHRPEAGATLDGLELCDTENKEGCFYVLPLMSLFGLTQDLCPWSCLIVQVHICVEKTLSSETYRLDRGKFLVTFPESPMFKTHSRHL